MLKQLNPYPNDEVVIPPGLPDKEYIEQYEKDVLINAIESEEREEEC